jgi:Uncharacterized conserved protein
MEKFIIKNFKCFKDCEIELNQLTLLVGANGFGKSSVIQSLLLTRHTIEHFSKWAKEDQKIGNWTDDDDRISINGAYDLLLGTSSSIINQDTQGSEIGFRICDQNDIEKLSVLYEIDSTLDQLWIRVKKIERNPKLFSSLANREFYYLNAERLGPRVLQPLTQTDFINVGTKGEFTAQTIDYDGGRIKVEQSRCFPDSKDVNLSSQVNFWLNDILPGVKISAHTDIKTLTSRLLIENYLTRNNPVLATNIGFGISYLLPIIVTGLIAKKDAYFIVENPEAHLHPGAQSKIGQFLSMVACAGVKVIVETHSDHVLNGVQIYIAQNAVFANSATVNFFTIDEELKEPNIKPISITSKGELSDWPKGFFDQSQIDYWHLSKLRRNV